MSEDSRSGERAGDDHSKQHRTEARTEHEDPRLREADAMPGTLVDTTFNMPGQQDKPPPPPPSHRERS